MEINKIIPEVQFYFSFGVLPNNPEAGKKVNEKINNMVKYAEDMADLVEYMEERSAIWDRIFHLTEIAQKSGYLKNKD